MSGTAAKASKWVLGTGLVGCLSLGGWHWGPGWYAKYVKTNNSAHAASRVEYYAVKRGDIKVMFVEGGKLRAVKNHSLFPKLPRTQLKITSLAPEGSSVKKGDVVATLDKKQFEDLVTAKKTELEGAKRQLTVKEAALTIQKSSGESAIAAATSKLDDAKVAYKTYHDLDAPKRLSDLDNAINEAREKHVKSDKDASETRRKLDDGLFMEEQQRKQIESEIQSSEENLRSQLKGVQALQLQRKIFRAYEYPRSLKNKQQAIDSAELDLKKANISAENEMNQKLAERDQVRDQIKRLEKEIDLNTGYIAECEVKAPADGLVLYGDPSQPWYASQVKIGSDWWGGYPIVTIPDLSSFEIDINIAEEYRGKVKEGLKASVTLEAVPGLQMQGELKTIGKLGLPRSDWDPNGPRVFKSAVALSASDPRMVSGMTSRVEILAETISDVLMVPIDAVLNDDGKTVCFVKGPMGVNEKRVVKVGRGNESFVEIVDGLKEGDQVSLTASIAQGGVR